MSDYAQKICAEAHARGITSLFHFTPAGNVRSILLHGLGSREALAAHGVGYVAPVEHRLDGRNDAVSLSIERINTGLLDTKGRTYRGHWVVFQIHASVLWTHRCRFCWTSAARDEIRDHRGFRGGPWAFERMFEDRPVNAVDPSAYRASRQRAPSQPTESDAEVQVLDPIGPDLILSATVESEQVRSLLAREMRTVDRVRPIFVAAEVFR